LFITLCPVSGCITKREFVEGFVFAHFTLFFISQKELINGQDSVDKENFVSELWSSRFKDIFNKTKVSVTNNLFQIENLKLQTNE
jgi:hypothetical protein